MLKSILRLSLMILAFAASGDSFAQDGEVVASPVTPTYAGPGEGLESPVVASNYRLGPGDVLTIAVWKPQPQIVEVPVSLEGAVIIPGVGTVDVSGDLLADAKHKIQRRLRETFRGVEASISLTRLRQFQVHVLGQVALPGTYLATAVDRVSSAVGWAGGFTPEAGQRRVLVMNQGEVREQADLQLFLGRGMAETNPLLLDGDVVYVPFVGHNFTVQGAVNAAATYQFLDGDTFSDALRLGGGMRPEARIDTIEVARYFGDDPVPFRFFVLSNGTLAADHPEQKAMLPDPGEVFHPGLYLLEFPPDARYPDFRLQKGDIIFVRYIPDERRKRLVTVRGEVNYPGTYAIDEGSTRLSDVVRMSGGLTQDAFLDESKLVRQRAIRLEDREFDRLSKVPAADMTDDEYEYFKVRSRENPGQMVIDFRDVFVEGVTADDVLLQGGDIIEIPARRDFVSVIGLVQYPGNVLYNRDYSPTDYVAEAGGYAERADKGKSRVIRAAGGEWVSLKDAKTVQQGDTIFIPEKGKGNFWGTFKDVLTVTTQVLAIYIVIDSALSSKN